MTGNVEESTARDPLRPILLTLLRSSMTPDTDAVVDAEADELDRLMNQLRPDDVLRLLFLAVSLLDRATPRALGTLNQALEAMDSPLRLALLPEAKQ